MDSSNFLTEGRTKLLEDLEDDRTLREHVRTWFDWGAGIRKRYNMEPATCPLISVVPAKMDSQERQDTNVRDMYPQMIEIGVATSGQDAEECERLVAACLEVIQAANSDCLGLASDGLNSVRLDSVDWDARKAKDEPRIVWLAAMVVRLAWRR